MFAGEASNPEHGVFRWVGEGRPAGGAIENLKDAVFSGTWVAEDWELLTPPFASHWETPGIGDEQYFVVFENFNDTWISSPLEIIAVPGFAEGDAGIGILRVETGTDTGIYKAQVFGKWPGVTEGVVPETVVPGSVVVQYRENGDGTWIDAKPNGVMFDVFPIGGDTDATEYEFRLLYKTADGWFVNFS